MFLVDVNRTCLARCSPKFRSLSIWKCWLFSPNFISLLQNGVLILIYFYHTDRWKYSKMLNSMRKRLFPREVRGRMQVWSAKPSSYAISASARYCTTNMSGSAIHFLLSLRMQMRMRIEYETASRMLNCMLDGSTFGETWGGRPALSRKWYQAWAKKADRKKMVFNYTGS